MGENPFLICSLPPKLCFLVISLLMLVGAFRFLILWPMTAGKLLDRETRVGKMSFSLQNSYQDFQSVPIYGDEIKHTMYQDQI